MRYYYVASLAGLRLEDRTDAGILQASGLAHARTLAEEMVGSNNPTSTILEIEVRPVEEEVMPCEL